MMMYVVFFLAPFGIRVKGFGVFWDLGSGSSEFGVQGIMYSKRVANVSQAFGDCSYTGEALS